MTQGSKIDRECRAFWSNPGLFKDDWENVKWRYGERNEVLSPRGTAISCLVASVVADCLPTIINSTIN
jgi:hypothetical protein